MQLKIPTTAILKRGDYLPFRHCYPLHKSDGTGWAQNIPKFTEKHVHVNK